MKKQYWTQESIGFCVDFCCISYFSDCYYTLIFFVFKFWNSKFYRFMFVLSLTFFLGLKCSKLSRLVDKGNQTRKPWLIIPTIVQFTLILGSLESNVFLFLFLFLFFFFFVFFFFFCVYYFISSLSYEAEYGLIVLQDIA